MTPRGGAYLSALVTYPDGSLLILEGKLSKGAVLREPRPVNYNDPPPPPAPTSMPPCAIF